MATLRNRCTGYSRIVERLENRELLTADIVISEIMASNESVLVDEDNDTPDWIEIHNVSTNEISLQGWYLTDNARDLTKWQFPDIRLKPNEYELIFASGKNRLSMDGNLHTNFKLRKAGEYLAIVTPDGKTISDVFDPEFPNQRTDVSYGRGSPSLQDVVTDATVFDYVVPTNNQFDDDQNGTPEWTQIDFDFDGWNEGQAGFGFDTETSDGTVVTPFTVRQVGPDTTFSGDLSHLINQPSPFLNPIPISGATKHSGISESDGSWLSSQPATLEFDLVFPTTIDHLLLWNYSFFDPAQNTDTQQGIGTKEFAVAFSNDGVEFSEEQFHTTASPVSGQPVPLEQFAIGERSTRFVRLRQIGSHNGGLYGLGEIAFSRGPMIDPNLVYDQDFVATDLSELMHETHQTSIYTRAEFAVANPASVSKMELKLRFDDGFIAYLNGVEVAGANAPESPDWASSATDTRTDHQAIEFSTFDLSAHQNLLQANNVLAIHGLNSTEDPSDFLLHPELTMIAEDPVRFGYLETPTPGTANAPRSGAAVQFSHNGGAFTTTVSVELSVDNDVDSIRYTLDGSEPDASSSLYGQPIEISTTTQLIARSFTAAGTPGPIAHSGYLKLADDLNTFDSNLPIMVIETFDQRISASTRLRSTYSAVFEVSSETGRAATTNEPDYAGRSGMRQRGRSSASFAQKQYKYETWDQDGDDLDIALLGLPAESDWVLNGPYTDKSLMRNVVTYQWWEDLGYYSPRTRFVEVFLNSDGDPEISRSDDYVGVYVLIESIKQGDNRIDIQTPEETEDPNEITGGYVIEVGNPGQFTTRISGRAVGYQFEDPSTRDLNRVQRDWIKDYIEQFETALYSDDFIHPDTGKHYTEYMDVESFVDYRVMREFTRDFDGGSTYFYIDRGGKITMGPMWDMNWALGNVNYAEPTSVNRCGCDIKGWNYSYTTPTIPTWPAWSVRLQEDPEHWQLIVDRWHELRQSVLNDASFLADIDANFQLLNAEAAERNFNKWRTLGRNTVISPPGFRERDTYEKEVDYLKNWLVQHAAWLDEQFVAAPEMSLDSGVVPAGSQIEINSALAPAGERLVEHGAQAEISIATDDSLGTSWTKLGFATPNWLQGTTGVGFDNSEGYKSIIGRDLRSSMGSRTSALIRIEFEFSLNADALSGLQLDMRYDDGFVAYINGTEVARSESVTNATPGSARARAHEAYEFETFDISQFQGVLQTGQNVLAIHGINTSRSSSDFLIIPELIAVRKDETPINLPIYVTTDGSDPRLPGGTVNPKSFLYDGPIPINTETIVRARTVNRGSWSALVERQWLVDVVPASAENLRISEIHYNPADADPSRGELDLDNDEFEFVEFRNVGERSINLDGVRLTKVDVDGTTEGIDFVFGQQSLAPGDHLVIVENVAAFVSRYGDAIRPAGQYNGKLSDAGEMLTVQAADGTPIQSFTYRDNAGWPQAADGIGPSLQIISTSGNYDSPGNWRNSGPQGGTPGELEFAPGDSNLDRVFNSTDLVLIFQSGEYEDDLLNNSTWRTGDWNGDGEFSTTDLVFAFQTGKYVRV